MWCNCYKNDVNSSYIQEQQNSNQIKEDKNGNGQNINKIQQSQGGERYNNTVKGDLPNSNPYRQTLRYSYQIEDGDTQRASIDTKTILRNNTGPSNISNSRSIITNQTIRKDEYTKMLEKVVICYLKNEGWKDHIPNEVEPICDIFINTNEFIEFKFKAFDYTYLLIAKQSDKHEFSSLYHETQKYEDSNSNLSYKVPVYRDAPQFGYFIAQINQ